MFKNLKILFFLSLILTIIVSGCGETTTPEKVQPENKETSATNNSKETKAPEVFTIGQSVEMGDLQFTVNSVRTSGGNEFFQPQQGNVYLLVDCTIYNRSAESTSISSLLMFKLVDGEGYSYDVALGPDNKGSLDGELASGRKMRGEVSFEVPAQAQSLELIFEPNVFGFGQAIYKIK